MLSFWEKITGYTPLCQVGLYSGKEAFLYPQDPCPDPAQWVHVWQTEQSEEERDYYCEKHALEHGLSSYETKPELAMEEDRKKMLTFILDDPPSTPDPAIMRKYLAEIEQQSQETLIPYGGSGAEEATIFEEEEDE